MNLSWNEWKSQFEAIEQKQSGPCLQRDDRHGTLYALFTDGYSPVRAFHFVRTARLLDRIGPYAISSVVMAIFGFLMMVKELLTDGHWMPCLFVALTGAGFALWVRHTIKQVAHFAANPRSTHLQGSNKTPDRNAK